MRVLQLGIFDRSGGACIAAYRQHTALLRLGVDSEMWVRFKVTNDPMVKSFTPSPTPGVRARRILRRHWLGLRRRRGGMKGEMFDDRSEYGGDELSGLSQADVVNLQFAWDFIDYPKFFRTLSASVPVVITMHEMAHFTGGCSYAGGCIRFQQRCGQCPKLLHSGEKDFSRAGWQRRKSAYASATSEKLHFVADSHWLAGEARKSSLLAGHPVSVIHYGLDTSVYRPMDRRFAREALAVPANVPVLAFAAVSVDDERKGIKHLIEAVKGMPVKPFLLTWGRNLPPPIEGISQCHLGNLDSEHLMALAYNAANVFVMPSLEEAFGQTALEAIACGTPVVAFAAGGIPDIVRHEETGLLATVGDSGELRLGIERILRDRELWSRLSERGRGVAITEFSMELNARKYYELYRSLLDANE